MLNPRDIAGNAEEEEEGHIWKNLSMLVCHCHGAGGAEYVIEASGAEYVTAEKPVVLSMTAMKPVMMSKSLP